MNKKLLILAVLLPLIACAIKKQAVHYADTKTVLAEIDKDKFGSTFISAIALNLAAKSPLEEISLLLDEVLAQLNDAQGKADEKNKTDQATCDESINGFKKQISEQEATIISLTQSIRENTEILEQAKIDLEQANKDYDETVEAIENGTRERELEHSKWTEADY